MKRTKNSLALLCAASVVALTAACAGGDNAATDSAAGTVNDTTPGATGAATTTDSAAQGALVDPNTASRDQLMAVPGMDATTADAIIAGRPYENMLGVDRVLVTAKFSEAKRDSEGPLSDWRPPWLHSADRPTGIDDELHAIDDPPGGGRPGSRRTRLPA